MRSSRRRSLTSADGGASVDSRPIGMFDSGIGGLTVLHECLLAHPHEDFIYLGDTGRFPYGPRSIDELKVYAYQIASHLAGKDIKLLVVACNSATAAALPWLQEHMETAIIGAVHPGAEAAVQTTRSRRLGVMATVATVASGSYTRAVHSLDAGIRVFCQPCPDLATMIQNGDVFSREVVDAVSSYAEPLRQAGVDTVILGSTHYPLAAPMIQRALGKEVALVNSAEEIAREVGEVLERKDIGNDRGRRGDIAFFCTGDVEPFAEVGARFLQMPLDDVGKVELSELERIVLA
ncbi:MAG TPA: glutamate racemase [Actinobacteria bacterium]|nr:glutamate racemase [Actinomycetota bacterium]